MKQFLIYIIEQIEIDGKVERRDTTIEEKIATTVCDRAKQLLFNLFKNLESRSITPKQLDQIKLAASKDYSNLMDILTSYFSTKYFEHDKRIPELLVSELKAYDYFLWRNIRLLHFAHIFKDIAKGSFIIMYHVMFIIFR